jgi:phospho-N-acetylmuramoyl-pentapeptide-transferase
MIYNLIQANKQWLIEIGLYRYLQVFDQSNFRAVLAIVIAFLIVCVFGRRTITWLRKQKIGDNPEFYNQELNRLNQGKTNTPTMGGILISSAIFFSVLLLADLTSFYVQMGLLCLVWLAGVGAADDWLKLTSARRAPGSREGLYSWEKFAFQFGIALLLGFFIHFHGQNQEFTHLLNLPFQRTYEPGTDPPIMEPGLIFLGPWLFGALAVLVIAGSSNAVNLTDGMDGLASGIMMIVSFAFMILCLIAGSVMSFELLIPNIPQSHELAIIAGAMCGACLGFLWFNCHPAQVFMGDTGSLPLGGLIGYIAVVVRQEILLLLIGIILVMEVGSVILQVGYFKLTGGSRIFRCTPIHHHFHMGGWTEQQVVVRFWLITALMTAVALATLNLR